MPLDAFIGARDALAASLRTDGDKSAAKRIKGLAKPSVSAWAVNQLHHHAPALLAELRDAGEAVRAAQHAGASELGQAMKRRRDAITAASARARTVLEEAGRGASDAVMRRIATTLEAIAAYGHADPPSPGPGRLIKDLDPPGFEILAALPAPTDVPATPAEVDVEPSPAARLADARASLANATAEVDALRRRARQLDESRAQVAARLGAARDEFAEAERRLERARDRVDTEQRALEGADADLARVQGQSADALAEMDAALTRIDSFLRGLSKV